MQNLSIIILQFIFIYLALLIGVPGTDEFNILKNKIILFCGIFIFQILIKSISKVKNNGCRTTIKKLLFDSFFISLLSIIGYSLYIDFSIMDYTKETFSNFKKNLYINSLVISGIISIFVFIIKIIESIFINSNEICDNNYYNNYRNQIYY